MSHGDSTYWQKNSENEHKSQTENNKTKDKL